MSQYEDTIPEGHTDSYVHVNGELIPSDEAHISAVDRGFLYGDSVFDSFPIYDSKAVLLERHIDRLFRSVRGAKMDLHLSKDDVRERVIKTLEASEVTDGGVRIMVTRGVGSGVRNADQLEQPTFVVIPVHKPREEVPYGQTEPIRETARIASTRVVPGDVVDPKIKDCNYLNNVLAERELVGTDANCAIMLDREGRVAESFDSNVFVLDERDTFRTPTLANSLGGITREVFIEQARGLGYDVEVDEMTPMELLSGQDTLLVGSDRGITTLTEIDGRTVGDAPVHDPSVDVTQAFRNYVVSNETVELST